jgi:hypothetical protein
MNVPIPSEKIHDTAVQIIFRSNISGTPSEIAEDFLSEYTGVVSQIVKYNENCIKDIV